MCWRSIVIHKSWNEVSFKWLIYWGKCHRSIQCSTHIRESDLQERGASKIGLKEKKKERKRKEKHKRRGLSPPCMGVWLCININLGFSQEAPKKPASPVGCVRLLEIARISHRSLFQRANRKYQRLSCTGFPHSLPVWCCLGLATQKPFQHIFFYYFPLPSSSSSCCTLTLPPWGPCTQHCLCVVA